MTSTTVAPAPVASGMDAPFDAPFRVAAIQTVTAIDVDALAVTATAANARLNELTNHLHIVRAGPEELSGRWPLVIANILAAPLIEMAPTLVRRVDRQGQLLLSGIPASVAPDVERAYTRLGMRSMEVRTRAGWVLLGMRATW